MPPSQSRIPVLAVAGPTASGKSALAVRLARELDGEVISADSMQVYAALSIGTARPSEAEMQGVAHHLLGFLPLEESYSVARYVEDASHAAGSIHARGRLPILCGGTGLYLQAFLDNLTFTEQGVDPALRAALKARAQQEGGQALLDELRAFDPETAARLHPNDTGRIVRAIEAFRTTGVPLSEQARRSRAVPSPYDACLLVLDFRDRQTLYRRINDRVDAMLAAGLLEEARRVLGSPHAATVTQAIGYKELAPYLEGTGSLEAAVEQLKQSTRRYAKRQLSWFRRMSAAHFVYVDDYPDKVALVRAALTVWNTHRMERTV